MVITALFAKSTYSDSILCSLELYDAQVTDLFFKQGVGIPGKKRNPQDLSRKISIDKLCAVQYLTRKGNPLKASRRQPQSIPANVLKTPPSLGTEVCLTQQGSVMLKRHRFLARQKSLCDIKIPSQMNNHCPGKLYLPERDIQTLWRMIFVTPPSVLVLLYTYITSSYGLMFGHNIISINDLE